MPPLSIMIKPSSSNCNLRCRYCFYTDESSIRSTASFGFMQTDTLEEIVKKALHYAEYNCTFAFQGGEPTLIGLPFYRKLIYLEKKYNKKKIPIQNIIQTNGYIIDESWALFLKKFHFFVGLSLDGTESINDTFRRTPTGDGTFKKVFETITLLKKYNIDFNILTVVTSEIARQPADIYRFYKKNHLVFQQYIPCLNPLGESLKTFDYSLSPELYGNFLCLLFDLWYSDLKLGNFIYISFFEDLLGILKGMPPASCTLYGECQKQYVIEANGNAYPCDFYALDNYLLGNITKDSFAELDKKREELHFISHSRQHPLTCSYCKWYFLCKGGCRRERDRNSSSLAANIFCSSYKKFFNYSYSRLLELSQMD